MPRNWVRTRGLGSHYRQDAINDIRRRLFVQSSPNHSYDSLSTDHHSPPRRTTTPCGPTPPPCGSTQEGPARTTHEHVDQAVAALQSIHGSAFRQDEEFPSAFRDLMSHAPVTFVIETVENNTATNHASEEGIEHNAAEAHERLWSRDINGRLQRGATGGSEEASDSHF